MTVLVPLFLSCGSPAELPSTTSDDFDVSILGGQEASKLDAASKSTVALYDEKSKSTCSGSVVAEDTILTAAHCVNPNSAKLSILFSNQLLVAGRLNRAQMRLATNFQRHPSYNPRQSEGQDTMDLALVHFQGGLPPGYQAVPLMKNLDLVLKPQGRFLAAGFGLTNGLLRTGLGTLRKVSLEFRKIHSKTEFQTRQNSVGVCSGDSGGPLFQEEGEHLTQVGVASRVATKFLGCRGYAVYTRVDVYQDWITQTAQSLRARAR